jgi:hypothetical protein
MSLGDVGSWLGQAATAFVALLAFIGIAPSQLVEKLFGHRLESRLAEVKHEQNTKIEALREQLGHLGDRGKRSNEREFEALSAAWAKFVQAFLSTNTCGHLEK